MGKGRCWLGQMGGKSSCWLCVGVVGVDLGKPTTQPSAFGHIVEARTATIVFGTGRGFVDMGKGTDR